MYNSPFCLISCRQSRAMSRYFLELCLQDYQLCQFPPSLLALCCFDLADELLGHVTRGQFNYINGYTPVEIHDCLKELRIVGESLIDNFPEIVKNTEHYRNIYKIEETSIENSNS